MKKLVLLLFIFSLLFASVKVDKTVTPRLYPRAAYDPLSTDVYAENTFTFSTTATVIDPAGGSASDLGDGAIICPGEVTFHSKIYSKFARNTWSAFLSVSVGDNKTSDYTTYTSINSKEFGYSSSKYDTYYNSGERDGLSPFSTVKEKVTFSPYPGLEFKDKEGYAGGVIKPKITFLIGGSPVYHSFLDDDEAEYSTNLGEGSYKLSCQLDLAGVLITVTRDHPTNNALDRTGYYSLDDPWGDSYTTSLPEAKISINVVNANDIQMDLVSRTPEDPVPLPTDMTIVVKNEGPIPIKVASASITPGYSVDELSGFGDEIPVGEEHTLKVHLEAAQNPPPASGTITLNYQSSGPTCDGTVKTETLNFAVSTETGKPDLAPQVSWSPRNPSQGDTVTFTIKDCNSLVNAGEHQTSYVIGTASNVVNIHALGAGQCYTLPPVSVVCNNQISVDVFSDSNNAVDEANEVNNRFIDTIYCNRTGEEGNNCTVTPSYAVFIPPSSKYFKLFCGVISCTNADWKFENLDEHVSKTGDNLGATVTVDANAPPQKGKLIADAKLNEIRYTCSSVIDIIKSECEDFI
ncbi:MAG: CARDB domain-containing protein [Candidatus Micrarchaeia archaeon]